MKQFILLAYIACTCFTATAQRPPQGPVSDTVHTPGKLGYTLYWQDEFNGNTLDTAKWQVRGKGPRALGFVSEEAVTVGDGYLYLHALKRNDSILISAVGTQNKLMTTYGYFECRAQLQQSPGVWGAFWLQSPKLSGGDDPALYGAEVDIMECFRKLGPDIVSHNVHWGPYGPRQQTTRGMQSYLKGVGTGFHTFALEWTPEKYIFYVDGYKFYEVRKGISQTDEYIILSMEIPNEAEDLAKTVFPDAFIVDWVRVYKKTGQQ
ncbi:MAG: glycoside hydrolase family 16 protein [Chitinophagaceae bacterium]|nr:glycoside hydrolase family 16 protein [Chitinophagaceae bacterium]